MFAKRYKHYPSRPAQTSLATAVTNITKPVTKNNFGPSRPNMIPNFKTEECGKRDHALLMVIVSAPSASDAMQFIVN